MSKARSPIVLLVLFFLLVPVNMVSGAGQGLEGEIYIFDTAHSLLDFTARHSGFSRVRGSFKSYRGAITYVEEDISRSSVSVVIDIDSLDTGLDNRDTHIKKVFFAAAEHPVATFHSARVEKTEGGIVAIGPLTLKGVSREIRIPLEIVAISGEDQFKHKRIAFTGKITIDRNDFNVVYDNMFWNAVVSEEILIEMDIAGRIFNSPGTIFPWAKNSIGKVILDAESSDGIGPAMERARKLWAEERENYLFARSQLARAGLDLSQRSKQAEALAVYDFLLEIQGEELDPEAMGGTYAAMAEAAARGGLIGKAEKFLAEARKVDPHNPQALEVARQLSR